MGNVLFPCAPKKEKEISVINLSESCLDRLIRENIESGKKSPGEELNIPENISESQRMMKLKCLDDAHSTEYGLTVQAFYSLADKVACQIEPIRDGICSPDKLIQCLKKNPCCTIKCMALIEEYIDCIDTFRINIIKEQIECELKEQRKKDQEIVEEFLKNENGDY